MNKEKLKILEMIQEGKITPAEGLKLLKAFDDNNNCNGKGTGKHLRFLVRSDSLKTINIKIPLRLLKVFSKLPVLGMSFLPEQVRLEMQKRGIDFSNLDFEELVKMVENGLVEEKLMDIDIDDPGEGKTKVEICVD